MSAAPDVSADVATWAGLVDRLVEQCAGDPATELAPLLGGEPDVVAGRARLYPYVLLCDVTALMGWAEHLDQPLTCRVHPAEAGTRISVLGTLYGVEVELIGVTSWPVPGGPGPAVIDPSALFSVVDDEDRYLSSLGPFAAQVRES